MSFKLIKLFERAKTLTVVDAEILVDFIVSNTDTTEMRAKRGSDFKSTGSYQIRVKPNSGDTALDDILKNVYSVLSQPKAKSIGILNPQINEKSVNSSKYSSVSFTFGDTSYDVVIAKGGNKGEKFEKDLLIKMDNLVAGIDDSKEAEQAFAALEAIDPSFNISNIQSVSPRSGSTKRSGNIPLEETGKIIADIIVKLKDGKEKYISVKNKSGSTVGQFGVSEAFTDDLKVNTKSEKWINLIEPLGLDYKKIEEGLEAAKNKTDLEWDDIQKVNVKIDPGTKIYNLFAYIWGSNYFYLREKTGGFYAFRVNEETLKDVILHNLRLTEIRYPSKERKQITLYAESDNMKFRLELRNPRGRGSIKPTQIQLVIMKSFI